ncbi:Transcriptional repressor XBP1 [Spathaspora sp. JA1]|nr:Transcriptional repressor XBP1 [Spathaspora sp. JA1]
MIPSTDYYDYRQSYPQRRPSLPFPLPSATVALQSPLDFHHNHKAIPHTQQQSLLSPLPPISCKPPSDSTGNSFQLPRIKLSTPITPPAKTFTYPITPPSPQKSSINSFVLASYPSPKQSAPRSSASSVSVQSLFNRQKVGGNSPKSKQAYHQSVFKYRKKEKTNSSVMISRFPTSPNIKKQKNKPQRVGKPKPKMKPNPIPQNVNFPVNKIDISNVHLNSIFNSIQIKKYSTAAIDPFRPYLTVYEYSVNDHWIIWDYETGFVHLTGIWKASLNASTHQKADIVKLLESTPKQYQPYIKRIRGGFLKIQGTWLPFKLCRILARRFCYFIRYELIPIFGADFPEYCLKPGDRGFGELKLDEITNEVQLDLPKQHLIVAPPQVSVPIRPEIIDHNLYRSRPLPLPMQTPDASPKQHFTPSTSSSTITSVFTNTNSSNSPNMSYTDMLDIVNASKCLQSIAQAQQQYNGTMSDSRSSDSSSDEETPNYTIKPISSPINNSGISSSLLAAAGVLPELKVSSLRTDIKKNSPTVYRRGSMKINDLLS